MAAATGLRYVLDPLLDETGFALSLTSVVIIAWLGGLGPCLVAQVLTLAATIVWFPEPPDAPPDTLPRFIAGVGTFFFVGIAVAVLGDSVRAGRRRLQTEQERLRATLCCIGDGVIATDAAGCVTFMNPVAQTLTGWTQEDACRRPLTEVFRIINETTRKPAEDPCAKVLRAGAVVGLANHTVLIAKDGVERPIDDSAAPIHDETGAIHGVVLVFRDATERRKAYDALQRLGAIVEDTDDAVIGKSIDGVITNWNTAAERMYGFAAEEAIGRHISIIVPEDRREELAQILQRIEKGERIEHWDTVRIRKDGTPVNVSLQISPIKNSYGEVVGFSKTARDITERKRQEAALEFLSKTSTTLAALVDHKSAVQRAAGAMVPFFADWCVVYMITPEGKIRSEACAHRDPEKQGLLQDVVKRSPMDWNSPAVFVQALRSGQTQVIADLPAALTTEMARDLGHLAAMRELNPRSVISVPLQIRDRTVGAMCFFASDPSRRYTPRDVPLAEDLARRVATAIDNAHLFNSVRTAERQKDEFLAMLAHELRNPLAAISYATEVARLPDVDSKGELLDMVERQVKNLARMIDDLLDISRITRGKVQLRREYVDAITVARRAAAAIRPLVEGKKHELVLELAEEPLPIYADAPRVEQIIGNLLANAAKYTPDGGRITVKAYAENGEAVIQVKDNGVGIAPDVLPYVFDLFTQADTTLDRSQGGLGIGLTVVRALVELHGGTITAQSAGVGKGSEFSMRLPLSQSAAEEERDVSTESLQPSAPLRVLVVDDNHDTAGAEARLLAAHGHQVQIAYDGLTAVEMAHQFQPHAILLDIGLPGLNGYEVAKRLRDDGLAKMTLIAVSGYGQAIDLQRSRSAGFDHHLVKPVDSKSLFALLQQTKPADSAT